MTQDEKVDGAQIAAQILNRMKPEARERIVAAIKQREPEIAKTLETKLYNFDTISELSGRSVQTLLQHVSHEDLVLSIQSANEPVKTKIFANMTRTKGELVRDEMTAVPTQPTRSRDAQSRIMRKLEELRARGLITTESEKDVWV